MVETYTFRGTNKAREREMEKTSRNEVERGEETEEGSKKKQYKIREKGDVELFE